jgi:hypothetical protein
MYVVQRSRPPYDVSSLLIQARETPQNQVRCEDKIPKCERRRAHGSAFASSDVNLGSESIGSYFLRDCSSPHHIWSRAKQ